MPERPDPRLSPSIPVLITAGSTRNPLDRMRYLSAWSSGRTGALLARALAPHRPVHVLGHPETRLRLYAPPAPWGPDATEGRDTPSFEEYGSTRDLMDRMQRWLTGRGRCVVIHAAAVGDYECEPVDGKVKSGQQTWTLHLRPAPRIADRICAWNPDVDLVTFKAAPPRTDDEELVRIARRQLVRTGSRLVFANVLTRLQNRVVIVDDREALWSESRDQGLHALVQRVLTAPADRPPPP